jgi:hypothetical protein
MDAQHGIAPQRGKSGALKFVLKFVILFAFGAAVLAIARAPVDVGSSALATTAQAGKTDRPAAAGPMGAQGDEAGSVRYFPSQFPDVRGDPAEIASTF